MVSNWNFKAECVWDWSYEMWAN